MKNEEREYERVPWEKRSDGKLHVMLPDPEDGSKTGEIVKWLVRPGDVIEELQPLVHAMFDSATVEIPSPVAGVLVNINFQRGLEVEIGEAICSLSQPT